MNRIETSWAWGLLWLSGTLVACSSASPSVQSEDTSVSAPVDVLEVGSRFPDLSPSGPPSGVPNSDADVSGEPVEDVGAETGEPSDVVIEMDANEPGDVSASEDVSPPVDAQAEPPSDVTSGEDASPPTEDVVDPVDGSTDEAWSVEGFNAVCDLAFLQEEMLAVLDFSANATTGCPWGEGDNLESSYLDAAARQYIAIEIPLPENAFVCGLDISIDESAYTVHNGLVLRIGDLILASNAWDLIQVLPNVPGALSGLQLRRYDWNLLKGKTYLTKIPQSSYCLDQVGGGAGWQACIKGAGWANPAGWCIFASKPEVSADMAYQLLLDEAPVVTATLIGDQGVSDCTHSGFQAFITVKYVDLSSQ